jgi:hypothetical protein
VADIFLFNRRALLGARLGNPASSTRLIELIAANKAKTTEFRLKASAKYPSKKAPIKRENARGPNNIISGRPVL